MPHARYWVTLKAYYFMKPSKSPLKNDWDESSLSTDLESCEAKVTCPRSQANCDTGLGCDHRPFDRGPHSPRCAWCVCTFMCASTCVSPVLQLHLRKEGPGSLAAPLEQKVSNLRCEVEFPRSQVSDIFCLASLFHLAQPQGEDWGSCGTQSPVV